MEKGKIRKKKRRKGNQKKWILLLIVPITIIIISAALHQSSPPRKEEAETYFDIVQTFALVDVKEEDFITVKELYFNLTAVGGDATDLNVIPLQGLVKREDWPYVDELLQGDTWQIHVRFPSPVGSSRKETKGYPVDFEIICDQAEGEITVYVTEYYS